MAKHLIRAVSIAVAAAFVAAAPAAAQQTTLKAVTAWPKNMNFVDKYMDWIKRVNEAGAGKVKIDYVGGPEVYPSFEQLEPLKRGVFASVITSTAYVAGALPELNATWFGFGASPTKLRESGLIALLDKIVREKAGVTLLGMPLQMRFNVYLKKPMQGINLAGFKLRGTPVYDPVLKGLGAATVSVPPSDLLTALDTGIVDGFAWPSVSVTGPGFARAIKYKVTPPWWVGTDVALMNAKVFDSLAPDARKVIVDTMAQIEKEVPDYFMGKEKEEDAAMAKMGIENIAVSEADMKKVHALHWQAGLEAFVMKPSPKYGAEIKKILEQFAPK